MSEESILSELRSLRAQLRETHAMASVAFQTALAAIGGARTALHIAEEVPLTDDARVALSNAHALLDRAIDRVEGFVGPEPADAG